MWKEKPQRALMRGRGDPVASRLPERIWVSARITQECTVATTGGRDSRKAGHIWHLETQARRAWARPSPRITISGGLPLPLPPQASHTY